MYFIKSLEKNMTPSTNHPPVPTMVVSRPGIMQQSLRALLADYHGIVVLSISGDGLSALSKIRNERPGLIIIDSNLLEEETAGLIAAVKSEQPQIHCLVFVQSAHQRGRMKANGADAVVMRDSPLQLLRSTLNHLTQMTNEP